METVPEYGSSRSGRRLLIKTVLTKSIFAEDVPSEMSRQYLKLMDILTTIVSRLDKLDELTNDIAEMAKRHEGYGVKIAHYKIVGDALLWTLEHELGRDWKEEVAEAWQTCYKILADTMKGALKRYNY